MSLTSLPATETVKGEPSPGASSAAAARISVPFDRIRSWGIKSALSLIDQALTSAAGFAVNVLLARWLPAGLYGAFAVTFAGFLFVSGFHNVLLLEPLSVMGPSRHEGNLPAYFRAQIAIHSILVGALSAVVLLAGLILWMVSPQNLLVGAIVGSALCLPFLLLLWLARRMCYVMHRPSAAVLGSGFYLSFILAGMFVLRQFGRIGPFSAFLLMAFGSLMGALILARRIGLTWNAPASAPRVPWRAALRENWTYGRWLVGSTVLYSVSSQTQMFLVAAFLGLGAAGILRAMQILSLVMTQVITATGLLVLPTLSSDFGRGSIERMHHKAMLVSVSLTVMSVFFVALLALTDGWTERLLFGGKYSAYAWLMLVLALVPAMNAVSMGYSMFMRAAQKPHFDLVSNAFAAPVAVGSSFFFIRLWGVTGGAASLVLSSAAMTIIVCVSYGYFMTQKEHAPAGDDITVRIIGGRPTVDDNGSIS